MRNILGLTFLILSQIIFLTASAQQLSSEDVEVVKDFQPILADAVKVSFPASIPLFESTPSHQKYNLTKKLISLSYTPPTLKPLAFKDELSGTQLPKAFIKTGYGNYRTIFVEGLYNSGRSRQMNYGAYFKHHSSHSKSFVAQDFGENKLEIFCEYFFKNVSFNNNIKGNYDVFHFYGGEKLKKNTSNIQDKIDSLKQNFTSFEYVGEIANYEKNSLEIDWKAQFKFDYLTNRFNANEWSPAININSVKTFQDNSQILLDIKFDYYNYKMAINNTFAPTSYISFPFSYSNTITSINPKYKYTKNIFTFLAGINLTFEKKTYLFPDLTTETKLIGDHLILFNGWQMHLQKNSFKTFTYENPFLSEYLQITNSKVEERFVGIKGNFKKRFAYSTKIAQKIINDMPLFINDFQKSPYVGNSNMFIVIYDKKTQVYNFQGELSYHQSEKLRISLIGDYFNYIMDTVSQPWHLPLYQINLSGNYNWNKFMFTTGLYFGGASHAMLKNGDAKKLNALTDINLGITFRYSKNLSFFLDLNNMGMQKYYRWYRYANYRENGMIGVKVDF